MISRTDSCVASWRTSSYSTGGEQCVEVAPVLDGQVAVRDSKNRDAGAHVFTRAAWTEFITKVKNTQF
jgi:hypothetical protein